MDAVIGSEEVLLVLPTFALVLVFVLLIVSTGLYLWGLYIIMDLQSRLRQDIRDSNKLMVTAYNLVQGTRRAQDEDSVEVTQ